MEIDLAESTIGGRISEVLPQGVKAGGNEVLALRAKEDR